MTENKFIKTIDSKKTTIIKNAAKQPYRIKTMLQIISVQNYLNLWLYKGDKLLSDVWQISLILNKVLYNSLLNYLIV